jgi:hypothetical protein
MIAVPLADRDVWHCEECAEVIQAAAATTIHTRLDIQIDRLRQLPPPARAAAIEAIATRADAELWAAVAIGFRRLRNLAPEARVGAYALITAVPVAVLSIILWNPDDFSLLVALWAVWLAICCVVWNSPSAWSDARKRRRAADHREVLREIAARATSAAAVGALAEALADDDVTMEAGTVLRQRLLNLLPRLDPARAARLVDPDVAALVALLPLRMARADIRDWELTKRVAQALSHTEFEPAVEPLQSIANGGAWSEVPPPEPVMRAAGQAADRILARLRARREQPQLLRSATPGDADASLLLRPASAGDEPPEQLLREAEGGGQ